MSSEGVPWHLGLKRAARPLVKLARPLVKLTRYSWLVCPAESQRSGVELVQVLVDRSGVEFVQVLVDIGGEPAYQSGEVALVLG